MHDLLQRAVHEAACQTGLDGLITPHVLRHAYATHSRESIDALRQLRGHVSIETTAGYLHPVVAQATNPLDDLLTDPPAPACPRVFCNVLYYKHPRPMQNDPDAIPASLQLTGGIVLILAEAAEQAARQAMRAGRHRFRRRIGGTLRPGPATPRWNALVQQAQPLRRKRGRKAQLARLLRLPRQRMQDCLKARTAGLDAERTLLLRRGVAARQQGRELVP